MSECERKRLSHSREASVHEVYREKSRTEVWCFMVSPLRTENVSSEDGERLKWGQTMSRVMTDCSVVFFCLLHHADFITNRHHLQVVTTYETFYNITSIKAMSVFLRVLMRFWHFLWVHIVILAAGERHLTSSGCGLAVILFPGPSPGSDLKPAPLLPADLISYNPSADMRETCVLRPSVDLQLISTGCCR